MASAMHRNTPQLPSDVSRLLEKLDQYLDISGGGITPEQATAAQQHELNAYEMIKSAAYRAVAETSSDIYVLRPQQPYTYSSNDTSIKPDVLVIIIDDSKLKYTIVVDAKNHKSYVPPKEWKKILRDMTETQGQFGILVLNETGRFSKTSQSDMETNDITTIRLGNDKDPSIIDTANYLGKLIDPSFTVSNQRFQKQKGNVQENHPQMTLYNPHATKYRRATYEVTHYFFKPSDQ